MVNMAALFARLAELEVTVGAATTLATCTAEPLLPMPETATTAFRTPSEVGSVENVYVSDVVVAAVTLPVMPVEPAPEKRHRVVGRRCREVGSGDGQRGRVVRQVGNAGSHSRCRDHRGDLHGGAAVADANNRDHRVQDARSTWGRV